MAATSLVVSAVTAGAVVFVISNTIHRDEQLVASLSTAKARSVTITATDPERRPLPRGTVEAISRLPAVLNALALGAPQSIQNASFPAATTSVGLFTARTLAGPEPYTMTRGRRPIAGEVSLSENSAVTLGVGSPQIGSVLTPHGVLGTVGTFTTSGFGQISELLSSAALSPSRDDQSVAILSLVVAQPADIAAISDAAIRLLRFLPPASYEIAYDQRAAAVDKTIRDSGRRNVRAIALGLIGFGALTAALSSFVSALTRRRDIARQRALGRTRLDIVAVATIHATLLATVGATLGASAAGWKLHADHVQVSGRLLVATIVVGVVAQALAALPGAAFGAVQDPAAILRVP